MVLYTFALRGEAKDNKDEINITKKEVDILNGEQLEEHFLCDLNSKGQVPVLAPATQSSKAIADSLKITQELASKYPKLMPSEKKAEIKQCLEKLHALNFFSLSFFKEPEMAEGLLKAITEKLSNGNISDRHRKALEFKLKVTTEDKVEGLGKEEVEKNEKDAREILSDLEKIMSRAERHPESWVYGAGPTALDAHLVPFIARMIVKRKELISDKLESYAKWAMEQTEWTEMMEGRKTMK